MKQEIRTNYNPCIVDFEIRADKPTRVTIVVYDYEHPNRLLINTWIDVDGKKTFSARLPLSPKIATIMVKDSSGKDSNAFTVGRAVIKPLERKIAVNDIRDSGIREFLKFAQAFSYNINNLKTGAYSSSNRHFHIELLPAITDRNGNEISTPARINVKTGIISVSAKKLKGKTSAYVFAILCHEFSHYFLNENIRDEEEADMNGLLMYLGLGYPRIEAYEAFGQTFQNKDTAENRARMEKIDKMIRNFDNVKLAIR